MAAKIHALLKFSVAASLLLVSAGAGYYYAFNSPRRDAQLDSERTLVQLRTYGQKRAEQDRLASEQRELERRQGVERAAAEGRYQTCLNNASVTHDASWTTECKRLAEKAREDHAQCLSNSKLPRGYCDAAYRTRDESPNCTLPVRIATALDGEFDSTRKRCLRAREAALQ